MFGNNKPMTEMTRRYGHTVYTVRAYCNPDSKATFEEKLLTLIGQEAEKQTDDKHGDDSMTESA